MVFNEKRNINLINETKEKYDNFFLISPKNLNIKFLSSRREINKLYGKKTEPWLVGWVDKKNIIHILKEDKFESESNHKKEDFPKILKHEIAHLYIHKITNCKKPIWIHEGLSVYLAGQVNPNISKRDSIKAITYFDKLSKGAYGYSGMFVYLLIKKFGKEKLLDLLKKLPRDLTRKKLDGLFKSVYGMSLVKEDLLKNL